MCSLQCLLLGDEMKFKFMSRSNVAVSVLYRATPTVTYCDMGHPL